MTYVKQDILSIPSTHHLMILLKFKVNSNRYVFTNVLVAVYQSEP